MKTSWRHLYKTSEDVFKTSWPRRIYSPKSYLSEEVLIKTNIIVLVIGLQNDFKTFQDVFKTSSKRLQNVFKTSCKSIFKTSSRRFQDVLQKRFGDIFKTPSRRFQDVFKTSSRRLQEVFKMSSRRLQGVLQRSLQDVFKTSHQVKLFNTFSKWHIIKTFLRRTAKTVIHRRICLGHTSFMVSVQTLQESQKFLRF